MVKYGLIVASTENIGDDIQSLAALQFLPRVDYIINRDYIAYVKCKDNKKIKAIMNGWFMIRPENWPPPSCIEPLFISFHLAPKAATKMVIQQNSIEYFKRYKVGCRDLWTLRLMRRWKVDAWFSGCLTLTLDYGLRKLKRSNKILIVDLDPIALKYVPHSVLREAEIITHNLINDSSYSTLSRSFILSMRKTLPEEVRLVFRKSKVIKKMWNTIMEFDESLRYRKLFTKASKIHLVTRLLRALSYVKKYALAKLVLTSRLHAALPAVAFGTSVIFVHRNLNDPRFIGLIKYVNHYELREFKKIARTLDYNNPPINPHGSELKELKQKLLKTVLSFVSNKNT